MINMRFISAIFALVLASCSLPPAGPERPNPLVGSWTWVRPVNNCREIYIFRTDGTTTTLSGDARFEGWYEFNTQILPNGRYMLKGAAKIQTKGTSCTGVEEDYVDAVYENSILFSEDGQSLIIFYGADTNEGFGPLFRVTP